MTEHRPTYNASSSNPHQQCVIKRPVRIVPEFAPMSKPDRLLLVPILESADNPGDPICLCLVHLGNEQLGLCSKPSTVHCPCCLHPVCATHRSHVEHFFLDTDLDAFAFLCETCAALPSLTRLAFHAFVVRLSCSPVLIN